MVQKKKLTTCILFGGVTLLIVASLVFCVWNLDHQTTDTVEGTVLTVGGLPEPAIVGLAREVENQITEMGYGRSMSPEDAAISSEQRNAIWLKRKLPNDTSGYVCLLHVQRDLGVYFHAQGDLVSGKSERTRVNARIRTLWNRYEADLER